MPIPQLSCSASSFAAPRPTLSRAAWGPGHSRRAGGLRYGASGRRPERRAAARAGPSRAIACPVCSPCKVRVVEREPLLPPLGPALSPTRVAGRRGPPVSCPAPRRRPHALCFLRQLTGSRPAPAARPQTASELTRITHPARPPRAAPPRAEPEPEPEAAARAHRRGRRGAHQPGLLCPAPPRPRSPFSGVSASLTGLTDPAPYLFASIGLSAPAASSQPFSIVPA